MCIYLGKDKNNERQADRVRDREFWAGKWRAWTRDKEERIAKCSIAR